MTWCSDVHTEDGIGQHAFVHCPRLTCPNAPPALGLAFPPTCTHTLLHAHPPCPGEIHEFKQDLNSLLSSNAGPCH